MLNSRFVLPGGSRILARQRFRILAGKSIFRNVRRGDVKILDCNENPVVILSAGDRAFDAGGAALVLEELRDRYFQIGHQLGSGQEVVYKTRVRCPTGQEHSNFLLLWVDNPYREASAGQQSINFAIQIACRIGRRHDLNRKLRGTYKIIITARGANSVHPHNRDVGYDPGSGIIRELVSCLHVDLRNASLLQREQRFRDRKRDAAMS